MILNVQFELKSNPSYLEFLRNNSYWYKTLTRDPSKIIEFKKQVKEFQKKQKLNRFTSAIEYIEMFQTVMSSLK